MKLIRDYNFEDVKIITEQTNAQAPKVLKIGGIYAVTEEKNRNGRHYPSKILDPTVQNYIDSMISEKRALGELDHSESIEIDMERACHKIVEMKKDGNVWYGKSTILRGMPKGEILYSLLENDVKVGMSTRGVGEIEDDVVTKYKMITVDVVHDPSAPGAFVNGILESKDYLLDNFGDIVEVRMMNLEQSLKNMPSRTTEKINKLNQALSTFLANL